MLRYKKNRLNMTLAFFSTCFFILSKGLDSANLFVGLSMFFFGFMAVQNKQLFLPKWTTFKIMAIVALIWAVLGLKNPMWLTDTRNFVFLFYGVILFYNITKFLLFHQQVKVLTNINLLVLCAYVWFALKVGKNPYVHEYDMADFRSFKTIGPTFSISFFMPFLYWLYNAKRDKVIVINFLAAIVTALICGNSQYLCIIVIVYAIFFYEHTFRRAFRYAISLLIILAGVYFFSDKIFSKAYLEKLSSITSPLQSETFQARISDLNYMLGQNLPHDKVFGDGIGVISNVYRVNANNWGQYSEFLEIDNGFYYVYHRFGMIGLLAFLYIHFAALRRIKQKKFRYAFLAYFIIMNILSTHYFTTPHTAFFIFALFKMQEKYSVLKWKKKKLINLRVLN